MKNRSFVDDFRKRLNQISPLKRKLGGNMIEITTSTLNTRFICIHNLLDQFDTYDYFQY